MPELPEVETIVCDLKHFIPGKTFSKVIVHDDFVLRCGRKRFIQGLTGQQIKGIYRRGKAIVMPLSSKKILVVQLMMTGQLIKDSGEQLQVSVNTTFRRNDKVVIKRPHVRITFIFSDGSMVLYCDQRRFGQWRLVEDLREIKYFKTLGPEPFSQDFSLAYLKKALKKTRRPIKNALLDHTIVAGIGNIYACEILFRAKVSPARPAHRLSSLAIEAIHREILNVLKEAIVQRGSSIRNYRDGHGQKGNFNQSLIVYGREGQSCPRCHFPIVRIVQAGRSTFYCSRCQK